MHISLTHFDSSLLSSFLQVTFPLVFDAMEFCTPELQAQLKGPRIAGAAGGRLWFAAVLVRGLFRSPCPHLGQWRWWPGCGQRDLYIPTVAFLGPNVALLGPL